MVPGEPTAGTGFSVRSSPQSSRRTVKRSLRESRVRDRLSSLVTRCLRVGHTGPNTALSESPSNTAGQGPLGTGGQQPLPSHLKKNLELDAQREACGASEGSECPPKGV